MEKEFTKAELAALATDEGVELTDDMLDDISGGAMDSEVWATMSPEERKKAQMISIAMIKKNQTCNLF